MEELKNKKAAKVTAIRRRHIRQEIEETEENREGERPEQVEEMEDEELESEGREVECSSSESRWRVKMRTVIRRLKTMLRKMLCWLRSVMNRNDHEIGQNCY